MKASLALSLIHLLLRDMQGIKQQVEKMGFAVVPRSISMEEVERLRESLDAHRHSTRNLLDSTIVRALAGSSDVRMLAEAVLGPSCFAVRGIYFNKNAEANWKVSWHQDCVIAVRGKSEVAGWGPWSCKAGVTHVRPPAQIVKEMLAIRIHLDDCGAENGPLRILPGTHVLGFLSDQETNDWPKNEAITCVARQGDAMLMRLLLLHASSAATKPSIRRVIHLEFAANDLPNGVQWHSRVF